MGFDAIFLAGLQVNIDRYAKFPVDMRITPFDVMEYLAGDESWTDFLDDFDYLTESDLLACLSFAAAEEMDDDYSHLRKAVI